MEYTRNTDPFTHLVVDSWAPPELVRAAEAEWPDERWIHWHRYGNGKLATKDPLRHPPACAELIRQMLCLPVGKMLGVTGAFGDWSGYGAGLHSMPPGSSLGLHLDSDHHPITGWRRAANLILFLNSYWPVDGGGELELWSEDRTVLRQSVRPQFNRLAMFVPSDNSWHGVSPIVGPEPRKTLSVFFWTSGTTSAPKRPGAQFVSGESYGG